MTGLIVTEEEVELHAFFEKLGPKGRDAVAAQRPKLYRKGLKAFVRVESKNSFWGFVKYGVRNPILWEPLHKKLCDFVSTFNPGEARHKLVLEPRGHIKSNIISVALPAWWFLLDPNERILIASHKDADAAKFMRAIRNLVQSDHWKTNFPEIHPKCSRGQKPDLWNDERLLIERDVNYVEATVEVTSIRQQVTGRHYSRLVADDLVTPDNVATPGLREKTSNFRKLAESLMDPGATEIVTGTRYHFNDEYQQIITGNKEFKSYDVLLQPALYDVGIIHDFMSGKEKWDREKDFEYLIFPTRFTLNTEDYIHEGNPNSPLNRKSLIAIYNKQGPTHFANQYMLEPFDPKDRKMHEGQLLEVQEIPDVPMKYYRCCDLSSEINSEHGESYTAIITLGVTDRCDMYITDIYWGNFDPHYIINELIRGQMVAPSLRPVLVTMESGPYDRMIRPFLLRRSRELGVMVPTRLMTGAQHLRRKEEHIEGIVPWLQCGKIHYVAGCRNINILKEEMNKYPAFERRDCVDALAQAPAMIFPYGSEKFLTVPDSPEELQRLAEESKRQELLELQQPTVITFGDIKGQILKEHRMRGRLGADRVRTEFRI